MAISDYSEEERRKPLKIWVREQNEVDRRCLCGCGGRIVVKRHHRKSSIPEYLHGHHGVVFNRPVAVDELFLRHVVKGVDGDDCWGWSGFIQPIGYGTISSNTLRRDGRSQLAHRISYELYHGVLVPADVNVLHNCDNRSCVNPMHLYLGDDSDNALFRYEREQYVRANRRKVQKVRRLAKQGFSVRRIGELVTVPLGMIRRIINGDRWAGVNWRVLNGR